MTKVVMIHNDLLVMGKFCTNIFLISIISNYF